MNHGRCVVITKAALDTVNNDTTSAAMTGVSGLALAGMSDTGRKALKEARDAYLRNMHPATSGGRFASMVGGHMAGTAGAALMTASLHPFVRYANQAGTLSDGAIDRLARRMGAPERTVITRVGPALGNVSTLGKTDAPFLQHTGTSMAAHELGHITSPLARIVGQDRMAGLYSHGKNALSGMPQLMAMLSASSDYDTRHGLKTSLPTKVLKAMNAYSALASLPVLAEEAQASIRGYKPVHALLGSEEARRYLGKAAAGYLTYLAPLLVSLGISPGLGRAGGRAASRLMRGA